MNKVFSAISVSTNENLNTGLTPTHFKDPTVVCFIFVLLIISVLQFFHFPPRKTLVGLHCQNFQISSKNINHSTVHQNQCMCSTFRWKTRTKQGNPTCSLQKAFFQIKITIQSKFNHMFSPGFEFFRVIYLSSRNKIDTLVTEVSHLQDSANSLGFNVVHTRRNLCTALEHSQPFISVHTESQVTN